MLVGRRVALADYTAPEHVQTVFDAGLRMLLGRGLVIRLVTWSTTLATLRFVTPADLGVLVVAQALFGLTGLLAEWGYTSYLIRRRADIREKDLGAFASVQLGVALVVVAAILATPSSVFKGWLGVESGKTLLVVVAIAQALAFGQNGSRAVLEREMNFGALSRIDVAMVFVQNVSLMIAAILGRFVAGIPVALVMTQLLGTAMFAYHVPRAWGVSWDIRPWLAGLREASAFAAKSLADTLNRSLLPLAIGAWFGLSVLGWWSVATRFGQINLVVFESFWRAGFPAASRLAEEPEKLDQLTESSFRRALRLSTPIALLVVFGAPLMALLFPLWTPAIVAAQIWSLAYAAVGSVTAALAPRQVALKGPRILVIEAVSVFVAAIGLLALLSSWQSTLAVAVAFLGCSMASVVVLFVSARGPVLRTLRADAIVEGSALLAVGLAVALGAIWGNDGVAITAAAAALVMLVVVRRPLILLALRRRGAATSSEGR